VQTIVERPAALDVHKARVTACARVPDRRGGREQHVAEFATTVRGLLALRDWLGGHAVTQVVMEATGVDWKAPWAILEHEFECMLVNARHVKQVPGRRTDVSDAAWLCQLAEAGWLKANFVPPKPIRELRNLTVIARRRSRARPRGQPAAQGARRRRHQARHRRGGHHGQVRARHARRAGRRRDRSRGPRRLARRQMRKKIPALREALSGHFDAHHRLWVGAILRHIDFRDGQIEQLTGMIEEQIRPFAPAVELVCTMTGFQRRGAECIIGEIGVDMTQFATARHLASWAGRCPGNDKSAGKRRSGKTRNGSKWLDFALEEAAMAAIRVTGHYLEAQYRRLKPRRGHKRALGAVKHTMICAIWHMLSTGETYRDLGGHYFTNRDPERQTRRLVAQLERLGHHVTLTEEAAAA
jgi:transposase